MAKKTPAKKSSSKKDFLVVGLGASAGGVRALQEFFATMPSNSGMAFVVILHLSPEHESSLAQILQTRTEMKVMQVTETVKVEPNNVYVIPPNQQLEMVDGIIRCVVPKRPLGQRVAIDVFFRTLADAYERNAVCIVLSGTGSDGTLGLKRVKESNGFAIVQDPEDAEYDSMPRAAINTQLADWILPVHQMPEKLLGFKESSERLHLTNGADAKKIGDEIHADESLREILTLLRVRTGHDFTNYKTPTLIRRIARHLQIHELEDIPAYLELLRTQPNELQSLLKNLLINVTNFFRDKEAFEALEAEIVPNLFAGKTGKDTIRIWSAGCASGEEAFSLAMILTEHSDKFSDPPKIQVFASDVDDEAISEAREHRYPESIEADVSPERLKRFFTKEGAYYRVKKELRETVLFAPHNVLRDPPFSRLDLVSCRNLLIYLNRETQERVLQIFHFALNSHGYLFLGSSETAENSATMFSPVDKKHRIYARRNAPVTQTSLPMMPVVGRWEVRLPERKSETNRDRVSTLSDIHYRLLENYAPSSVLVNQDFDIVYLSGTANKFLRFVSGEPSRNLLKAVVPDLLPDLRAALFTAQREHKSSEFPNIRLRLDGEETTINLIVRAVDVKDEASDFLLVIFEEKNSPAVQKETNREMKKIADKDEAMETVVRRLEEDLQRTKEHLRTTIEQHETTVEELKASNEELQAINEELRSASEELETSKEELQSVNEELTTVNHELKDKIDETSRINSDLSNLMAATDIATIFLDKQLKIKRYTPPVEQIFNLTPGDVGRPLEHFTHHLNYKNLSADAEKALRSLTTIEHEITDDKNRSFLSRFLPYRTIDDRIDGVVLNFIDITERKKAEAAVRESEEKYRTLFNSIDEGVTTVEILFDENGKAVDLIYLEQTAMSVKLTGLDLVGKKASEALAGGIEPYWMELLAQVAVTGEPLRTEYHVKDMGWFSTHLSRVGGADSRKVISVFTDITERKRTEANLAFLAEVTEDLAHLANIEETMNALGARIGAYFGVRQCIFTEYADKFETAVVNYGWHAEGARDLKGTYRMRDFVADEVLKALLKGESLVVGETQTDKRVSAKNYGALGIRSLIIVPIIHAGEWQFQMSVTDDKPREWRADETELLREITTRIWTRLERARAEEALQESEKRLRLATEAAEMYSWEFDATSETYKFSANAPKILGIAPEELPATVEDTFKLVHPDDRELMMKTLEKALKKGGGFSLDLRSVKKSGEVIWLSVQTAAIKDASGAVVRIIGIAQNITERKRAEEALRDAEQRTRITLEAADLATWEWNLETGEVFWNEQHFRLFGMKPLRRKMTPDDFFRHVHPDHREYVGGQLKKAVEQKTPFDVEFCSLLENGETRWMSGYGRVTEINAQGETTKMSGVMFDITERKTAAEVLRKNEEQLQLILESTRDYAIITYNLKGIITRWNTGAEKIFGWKESEILGKDSEILFTPEDRAAKIPDKEFKTALKKGRSEDERWHIRKDGSRFFASGVMQPLKDGKLEGFVKIARDQTERLKAEQLQHEQEMLRRLVNAQEDERRRIARDIHDHLGQQLTALRLKLSGLKTFCEKVDFLDKDKAAQNIDELIAAGERIDKDVDFIAWELRPVALDDLGLRIALATFVTDWSNHSGVKTEFHAGGLGKARLGYEIETNLYRIAQEALNNILKHARATQVSVLLEKSRGTISLIIEDNGVGFNPPRDKASRQKGLGLVVMLERARIIGGNLEIESAKGKGTTVFARIPLKK